MREWRDGGSHRCICARPPRRRAAAAMTRSEGLAEQEAVMRSWKAGCGVRYERRGHRRRAPGSGEGVTGNQPTQAVMELEPTRHQRGARPAVIHAQDMRRCHAAATPPPARPLLPTQTPSLNVWVRDSGAGRPARFQIAGLLFLGRLVAGLPLRGCQRA
jgi:hypothetical protein